MITVEIDESTPANMLRAIRAACNELLGEQTAPAATLSKDEVIRRESMSASHAALQQTTAITIIEPVEDNRQDRVPAVHMDEPAEELDSAGHTWNAELHASTKSKNADGTWKKRRTAAQKAEATAAWDAGIPQAPAAPPLPPAAPAAEPIMPKIFALIASQIVTINQAVEAAQAEGFADLGANGLGGAPVEKQLAVLRKLEG